LVLFPAILYIRELAAPAKALPWSSEVIQAKPVLSAFPKRHFFFFPAAESK